MKAHDEVQLLLPWFINGSLNEDEHSLVNRHLRECNQCQADVDRLLQIGAQFAKAASSARWRRSARDASAEFVARLDRVESRRPLRSPRLWIGAAAAACSLVIAIFLFSPVRDAYRTLGAQPARTADAPVIQVVFRPEATERSIRNLLLDDGNEVLSGPTRQGVYRVALGEDQRGDVYVARLRHHPDVIFIQQETNP